VSPPDLDVLHMQRIVLGIDPVDGAIDIAARGDDDAQWEVIATARIRDAMPTSAGIVVDCRASPTARLRVTFAVAPRLRVTLARVALLQS
jgi:hypothetical protein